MDRWKQVLSHLEDQELIQFTQDLIQCDTVNPPGNEQQAAKIMANKLSQYGIEGKVERLEEGRANTVGIIKGSGERPGLLFNGHLDTVPPGEINWEYPPLSGQIVDGKLYGRGASDMKSGLAALTLAACLIKKSGISLKGDLVIAGTAGEEVDSLGAKDFVRKGYLNQIGNIVIAEPSNLKLFTCHKGALWLEFTTRGKTAHGSMPDLGRNAILSMNRLISRLEQFTFDDHPHELLTPPTLNVGTISGGVKTNVVPDQCVLTVDIRTVPGQDHGRIVSQLESMFADCLYPGDEGDLQVVNDRDPVETSSHADLVRTVQAVGQYIISQKLEPAGVNYYTDASVFVKHRDIPMILLGPGDERLAHQPNEYVEIDKLITATKMYVALALRLLT